MNVLEEQIEFEGILTICLLALHGTRPYGVVENKFVMRIIEVRTLDENFWKKAVEFDDTPSGIAVNENGEVVVVGPEMLIESDDKNNWRSYKLDKYSNSSDMDSLESVTFGKGKFVAVGIKGVILFR